MDNELIVMMASDDGYSFLLGNALYSLFDTNTEFTSITVYIIDDNISDGNKQKIQKLAEAYKRIIRFLSKPHLPSEIVMKGTLNISTYYRLAVCSLLPEKIKKILYLDCDILVRSSLTELWNMDISSVYLAGVQDTTGKNSRIAVELGYDADYVNAGVLLLNIDRMCKDGMEEKFFEYLKSKNYKVEFNDQGMINHCCIGGIKLVNPKYNFMIPYDRYDRVQLIKITQKNEFYSETEIAEAKNNPVIVHFAGYAFSRPWFEGSTGRFVKEFLESSKKSGFTFTPKKQPTSIKYKTRSFANLLSDDLAIKLNQLIDNAYRVYSRIKANK